MGASDAVALANALDAELNKYAPARDDYFTFVQVTKPDMLVNWFHALVCKKLQKFYDDVVAGLQPRLMILAPPRHGKTELVSRRFPAWVFGKDPRWNFVSCSYAASLAHLISADVQRIMEDQTYNHIFPASCIAGSRLKKTGEMFQVPTPYGEPGLYRAVGVNMGITGTGFQIGLIDDPIKDHVEASSEVTRESIWDWYQSTFYTRQAPFAGILLVQTRWNEDDLAGRLLKQMRDDPEADQWEVIEFPAIAECDETYRKQGEALVPMRYPLQRLKQFAKTLGSYHWSALYQQRPGPRGGTIFLRGNFNYWTVLPNFDSIIMSVDCSFKDLKTSDFVAIQAWGIKGADRYLMMRRRERMGFGATVTAIKAMRALLPKCDAILVEDKANGTAVIETLQKTNGLSSVKAIDPEGGKVARAFAVQADHEAGCVYIPDPSVDPTIETFIHECATFPNSKNDDEVDAMTQLLNYVKNRGSSMGLMEYYRQLAEEKKKQNKKGMPGRVPVPA